MSVILREKQYIEKIIDSGEVGENPASTLFLLSKYYRQVKKLNLQETVNKLSKFMEDNYKGYNSVDWEDIIEDISKKGKKYQIQNIEYIPITENELKNISSANKINYQKLLFTLLCYGKFHNMLSSTNNGWVNTDIKEIYKIARVTVKYKNDKFLYLNDLEQLGLIAFSSKNENLNLRVNFIDNTSEIKLKVTDFRELGYQYSKYINWGQFVECSMCGRLIPKRGANSKYCHDCAEKQRLETYKKYNQKRN